MLSKKKTCKRNIGYFKSKITIKLHLTATNRIPVELSNENAGKRVE